MATDWRAMQAMETVDTRPDPQRPGKTLQTKERRPIDDCNIKALTMASWHAKLSLQGRSRDNLGSKSGGTGQAGVALRKKK